MKMSSRAPFSPLSFISTDDDRSILQFATRVLLTGVMSVFLFHSSRRGAKYQRTYVEICLAFALCPVMNTSLTATATVVTTIDILKNSGFAIEKIAEIKT
ncbi:hypothetical protein HanIR_Chr06g0276061 [Helianthus annuus]|nr:hypothetical protein HanIR_Chr06g0276061 [Helianthus annuus]